MFVITISSNYLVYGGKYSYYETDILYIVCCYTNEFNL